MKTDPTPFPYDASYEGYPKAVPAVGARAMSRLYAVGQWIGFVLAAVGVFALGLVITVALLAMGLCLAPVVLVLGGSLHLFFRGDKEVGVE